MIDFDLEELVGNADLDTILSRVVNRPADLSRVVCELFEVDERAIIFTPRYRVLYRNLETEEEGIVEFEASLQKKSDKANARLLEMFQLCRARCFVR